MAVGLVQADGMGQRFGEGAEAQKPLTVVILDEVNPGCTWLAFPRKRMP